jgi:hypothetical protein
MGAPVLRYVVAAVVGIALLVGLMLLVRPFIFSFAAPRDDTNYAVIAADAVGDGPVVRDLLLNEPHNLLGERPSGQHAEITVIVSRDVGGEFSVVNAWSTARPCTVSVVGNQLQDCGGAAWTLAGDPLAGAPAPLQRWAVRIEQGALIVDFTQPIGGGGG